VAASIDPPPGDVEHFRPGRVTHALVSGLVALALASVCLGVSFEVGERSDGAGTSLIAAAVLCAVLGVWSLVQAGLRARVLGADLDDGGVTLRGVTGCRAVPYGELSAVEVRRGRTRLVTVAGRTLRVHGVRGVAQGRRFRERVLARATAANRASPDRLAPGSVGQPDQPVAGGEDLAGPAPPDD
jgi:hypothetical protein